ncbi:Uridine phosphorylase [Streptococcus pluranimalium]|uniref:nucleoside phosphorylase n=1 Tax=Streptococcus pluranimalium TaxID=82348 RepID=UPI0039E776FC
MTRQPHIQLEETLGLRKAILVGDPARLDVLLDFLEDGHELGHNREFRSISGTYKGVPILGISTGIGAPSTAIAVEELAQIGIKEAIRVGSAGAYQSSIALGELIIGTASVRDDGLTSKYVDSALPALPSLKFLMKAKVLAPQAHFGMIRSHDGFYMDHNEEVEIFWSEHGVLGADMESSTLLVLGHLRGIQTLSILNNVVLWGQDVQEGINDLVNSEENVSQGEKESLKLALDILGDNRGE